MAQSMTGFGRAEAQFGDYKLCIELKSLNSKTFDLNIKLPYKYKEKEFEIRKKIIDFLFRGKIDCYFTIENLKQENESVFNHVLIQKYMAELQIIAPDATTADCLKIAVKMPDALSVAPKSLDAQEWAFANELLDKALQEINQHRSVEGNALKNELINNVQHISNLLLKVQHYEESRIEQVKTKYKNALSEFDHIDEQRYYQEVVYFIEKLDITEEKVRLTQHADYFLEVINNEENPGKKLAFIGQEMGREINTLGSKANHADIQKLVVGMKESLEKIKEQLLNVL